VEPRKEEEEEEEEDCFTFLVLLTWLASVQISGPSEHIFMF
jgi:hypothetical protein